MNFKRSVSVLTVAMFVVALFVTSFGITNAQDGGVLTVSMMGQDDIPTLDPSLAEDVSGIQGINMLFPGLTTLNETTVQVEPGIAESWEISEDGLTYTFTLMPDIAWVRYDAEAGEVVQVTDADGNPLFVTAQDVAYGINRTLTLQESYYATVLDPWVDSVEVIDDLTIAITSPEAVGFLANIYGMWMARPQPAPIIEAFGDVWTEPENIATYGPFALKEWNHDEDITFIANPFWAGTDAIPVPAVAEVNNRFLESSAALAAYEAGEIAYVQPVPAGDIDRLRVEYPDEYGVGPGQCTYYYGFNTEKAPFDDVRVRRAFSQAIPREDITFFLNAGQQPAGFFTRPDMIAAPAQEDYPDFAATTDFDNAAAELQAYLDETGQTAADLNVELVYNESETHAQIAEIAQQQWSETLGVDVSLQSLEWSVFLDLRTNDAPQIFRAAWCFDHPDAHNWLSDVFRSDAGEDGTNDINWANDEFDALVDQAKVETDVETRRELYAQAENLLVSVDVGIAPIYYYTTPFILSQSVDRPFSNTGIESFEKWSISN